MKKLLTLLMVLSLFIPTIVNAQELTRRSEIKLIDNIELKVKDLPKEYKELLGGNYILVDYDFFVALDEKAQKADLFEKRLNEVLVDLNKFKLYSTSLERIIKEDRRYIGQLEDHITVQERMIANLQPTLWDKSKFGIGILLGAGSTIGTAILLDQLND